MWNDGNVVDLVSQYPVIWRKKDPLFRNKLAKNNAWMAISKQLQKDVKQVQQRWSTLRNKYVTELRLQNNALASGSSSCGEEWHMMGAMGFLKTQIQPRKIVENVLETQEDGALWTQDPLEVKEDVKAENFFVEDIIDTDDITTEFITEEATSSTRNEAQKSQKRKTQDNNSMTEASNSMTKYLEKRSRTDVGAEDDEDMLFGRSVGEGLRKINIDKVKYSLKSKIMCLFAEAMEGMK